jgi:hypothetical protein
LEVALGPNQPHDDHTGAIVRKLVLLVVDDLLQLPDVDIIRCIKARELLGTKFMLGRFTTACTSRPRFINSGRASSTTALMILRRLRGPAPL